MAGLYGIVDFVGYPCAMGGVAAPAPALTYCLAYTCGYNYNG